LVCEIWGVREAAGVLDSDGRLDKEALLEFEGALVLVTEGEDEGGLDSEGAGVRVGALLVVGV
jgi:hypothetical protein